MALSWNEIKDRAVKFSKEWAGTFNKDARAEFPNSLLFDAAYGFG